MRPLNTPQKNLFSALKVSISYKSWRQYLIQSDSYTGILEHVMLYICMLQFIGPRPWYCIVQQILFAPAWLFHKLFSCDYANTVYKIGIIYAQIMLYHVL